MANPKQRDIEHLQTTVKFQTTAKTLNLIGHCNLKCPWEMFTHFTMIELRTSNHKVAVIQDIKLTTEKLRKPP